MAISLPPRSGATLVRTIQKVNLREKLSLFRERWQPKIVGEVNDMLVKAVKFQGEFV